MIEKINFLYQSYASEIPVDVVVVGPEQWQNQDIVIEELGEIYENFDFSWLEVDDDSFIFLSNVIEDVDLLYQEYSDAVIWLTDEVIGPEQWLFYDEILEDLELLYQEYSDAVIWLTDEVIGPEQWLFYTEVLEDLELIEHSFDFSWLEVDDYSTVYFDDSTENPEFLYQEYSDAVIWLIDDNTPDQWLYQTDLIEQYEDLYDVQVYDLIWLIDDNTPYQWLYQTDLIEQYEDLYDVQVYDLIWEIVGGEMPDEYESHYIDQWEPKEFLFDDYSLVGAALFTDLPALLEQYFEIHKTVIPYYPGQIVRPGGFIGTFEVGSTFTPVANKIYYSPFYIPYPMQVTELGVLITTADYAGKARIGLYDTHLGRPKNLIYQNVLNLNSIGYRPILGRVYLSAGLYWTAFLTKSTTVVLRKILVDRSLLGVTHSTDLTPVTCVIEDS